MKFKTFREYLLCSSAMSSSLGQGCGWEMHTFANMATGRMEADQGRMVPRMGFAFIVKDR